jgi:glycosyltransferase involved in cell wall biosynthesis
VASSPANLDKLPSLTAVVITYQRRDQVLQCLQALDASASSLEKIVVVIDGSTDGTSQAIERLATSAPLVVISQPNRGQATARNRGAALVESDLIYFLDDDMEVQPGSIDQRRLAHLYPADVVMGAIPVHPDSPDTIFVENVRQWADGLTRTFRDMERISWDQLLFGNTSVRRDVFEHSGGFRSEFTLHGGWGNEDLELALRLEQAGCKLHFSHKAVARQRFIVRPLQHITRYAKMGLADVMFSSMHPTVSGVGKSPFMESPGLPTLLKAAVRAAPSIAAVASWPILRVVARLIQDGWKSPWLNKVGWALCEVHYDLGQKHALATIRNLKAATAEALAVLPVRNKANSDSDGTWRAVEGWRPGPHEARTHLPPADNPSEREPAATGPWGESTVSVVINTFNQTHFLREAVESVLRQTVKPTEVIVVDDGSSDHPETVVSDFPGLRLISQANEGPAAARNAGWYAATGTFVVFLDADDRLTPEAIEWNLAKMAAHPDCAFVYGAHREIDESGHQSPAIQATREPSNDVYSDLLEWNIIAAAATVMFRRAHLQAIGGFDQSLKAFADYDVYLRLGRLFPVAHGPEILAEDRIHTTQMSRDTNLMRAAVLRVLRRQEPYARKNDRRRNAYARGLRAWERFFANAGVNDAKPIPVANAYLDLENRKSQDVGFPLVSVVDQDTLMVHPLIDSPTLARIDRAVPAEASRVEAECVLLDSRSPSVAFRIGIGDSEAMAEFSEWVELPAGSSASHRIALDLGSTAPVPKTLLLQTKLATPGTHDYAQAAFRKIDARWRSLRRVNRCAGLLQTARPLRDYRSSFPIFAYSDADGAFHHPLPATEVFLILRDPIAPDIHRITATARIRTQTSPAVDFSIALYRSEDLENLAIGDFGAGSLAFSGWHTLGNPFFDGHVTIDVTPADDARLVLAVRPGPSGKTDYAAFFWTGLECA